MFSLADDAHVDFRVSNYAESLQNTTAVFYLTSHLCNF